MVSRNQGHIWGEKQRRPWIEKPRGPVHEEKDLGGEQGPIENKGKRSTGTRRLSMEEGNRK